MTLALDVLRVYVFRCVGMPSAQTHGLCDCGRLSIRWIDPPSDLRRLRRIELLDASLSVLTRRREAGWQLLSLYTYEAKGFGCC